MTALGQLLTLLHDSDELLRSFEGEIRDWAHPPPSRTLIIDPDVGATGRVRWAGAGPLPNARETHRHVWYERRDRTRVELRHGNELVRVAVQNGRDWRRWDKQHGSHSGLVRPGQSAKQVPALLRPAFLAPVGLINELRFESPRPAVRIGRDSFTTRARLRQPPPESIDSDFELEFDAQTGTMLRWAEFRDGRCIQLMEVVTARFGGEIDPDRFLLRSPHPGPQGV